jgi:hypothetical protein
MTVSRARRRADANTRAARARARSSVFTEIDRIFGPPITWTDDVCVAVDRVTAVSDIGALRGIAFLLANSTRRDQP